MQFLILLRGNYYIFSKSDKHDHQTWSAREVKAPTVARKKGREEIMFWRER